MNGIRGLIAAACACMSLLLPSQAHARAAARPIRIAVIDSGIARTPTLDAIVETEIDMVDHRAPFTPVSDHGTAVATIVAMSSHVPIRIVSLRVDREHRCDPHACQMETYAIVSAIHEAIEMDVDVVNLSIDLEYDRSISLALQKAASRGIRIVVAAGNQGGESRGAIYARTIPRRLWLVGASDDAGRPASFSDRAETGCACQFVWKPGMAIETQNREGAAVKGDGTSFAAPLMTAELADSIGARRRDH